MRFRWGLGPDNHSHDSSCRQIWTLIDNLQKSSKIYDWNEFFAEGDTSKF